VAPNTVQESAVVNTVLSLQDVCMIISGLAMRLLASTGGLNSVRLDVNRF
jgi:hypothetical protein